MEIWKDIKGYPNYQISNFGRIKSLNYNKTGKEKILKSSKDSWGYLKVNLHKEGKQKTNRIHRLVASTFIPNPNNLSYINHINENKTDNRVENLEWCTAKYNANYGTAQIKRIEKKKIRIFQFTKDGEFVRKWDSATQVQKELGFNQSSITKCCKGKCKSAYGYKWGYADDYEKIPFRIFDLEIYRKKVS